MNVLILMADQLRWDALGCAGGGLEGWQRTWLMEAGVRTPHLDRLAESGARFTQAVANLPVCVPCRHSFITGLYPHQTGILTNRHYWPYDPPVPTLGHRLKEAGYATAAVGKMHWKHRNAPPEHVPDKRGFDFRASRGGPTDGPADVRLSDLMTEEERRAAAERQARFGIGGEGRDGYVGDVAPQKGAELPEAWLAEQAVQYLRRHREAAGGTAEAGGAGGAPAVPAGGGKGAAGGQPFCLIVSLDRPHPPNVIPADYDGMYDPDRVPLPPPVPEGFHEDDPHVRREIRGRGWGEMDERELRLSVARYLTNVTYVDDCLGRVLDALEECGYAEETIVALFSDHGEMLGERGRGGRGGAHTKYSLYDAAARVPLLVRWPGVSRPGLVSHAAVELIDLMPTWLDAAGLEIPAMLPGRSLRPLLEGRAAEVGWRTATLSEQYTRAVEETSDGGAAVGQAGGAAGRASGAAGGTSVGPPAWFPEARGQWTYREARWKLIERAGARSALYDLRADPNEHHNLIDEPSAAGERDRLRAQLLRDMIARAERFPARWEPMVTVAEMPAEPGAAARAGGSEDSQARSGP